MPQAEIITADTIVGARLAHINNEIGGNISGGEASIIRFILLVAVMPSVESSTDSDATASHAISSGRDANATSSITPPAHGPDGCE
jgi:hypothetical protein